MPSKLSVLYKTPLEETIIWVSISFEQFFKYVASITWSFLSNNKHFSTQFVDLSTRKISSSNTARLKGRNVRPRESVDIVFNTFPVFVRIFNSLKTGYAISMLPVSPSIRIPAHSPCTSIASSTSNLFL